MTPPFPPPEPETPTRNPQPPTRPPTSLPPYQPIWQPARQPAPPACPRTPNPNPSQVFKGTPPPTASGAVVSCLVEMDGAAAMDEDGGDEMHDEGRETHGDDRRGGTLLPDAPAAAATATFYYDATAASSTATASPPHASASASEDASAESLEGSSPRAALAPGGDKGFGMLQEAAQLAAAKQAEAAEQQLQRWSQLGDASLKELLHKDAHTTWSFVVERDGISGHSAMLPPPADASYEGLGAASEPPPPTPADPNERLDYCVKSECVIDLDPTVLADAYMKVGERHTWHSACRDSRLVEEIWPDTLRVAVFTYRTELPVFPRGYCALIHRASHRLPDGRTQIAITDRSVAHPAMPASRHFIFMTVYPSGMLITPVQQGGRVVSHVKIISHFHLRGTVSPSLLHRLRGNRMLEACCFNYLNEFRSHVLRQQGRAPYAPLAPPPPHVDVPAPAMPARDVTPPMPRAGGEEDTAERAAGMASTSEALETSRLETSRQDAADALIYAASC